jgi:hypothetical protein
LQDAATHLHEDGAMCDVADEETHQRAYKESHSHGRALDGVMGFLISHRYSEDEDEDDRPTYQGM